MSRNLNEVSVNSQLRKPQNSREAYIQSCKATIQDLLKRRRLYIYYLRDCEAMPYGVIVGLIQDNGSVAVGYSQCNMTKDRWNRHIGIQQAIKRAQLIDEWTEDVVEVPDYDREYVLANLGIMAKRVQERLSRQAAVVV